MSVQRAYSPGEGYILGVSLHFLNGFTLYRRKFNAAVPISVFVMVFTSYLVGTSLFCYVRQDDIVLQFDAVHYALHMVTLLSVCWAIIDKRNSIDHVNGVLDTAPIYEDIREQCLEMKKKGQAEASRMSFTYRMFMYSASVFFSSVQLVKLGLTAEKDRTDLVRFLMFPSAFPFPLIFPYTFVLAYISEFLCSTCSFVLFTRFTEYLISVSVIMKSELEIIGLALATVRNRSILQTEEELRVHPDKDAGALYMSNLTKNTGAIIAQHHEMQKVFDHIQRLFTLVVTVVYSGGVWMVCLSGVLLTTVSIDKLQEETFLLFKFGGMLQAELSSLFVYSLSSEIISKGFEGVRDSIYNSNWMDLPVPTRRSLLNIMTSTVYTPNLRSIVGYRTNMQNLSAILNASYSYFSMIIAMKNK